VFMMFPNKHVNASARTLTGIEFDEIASRRH
jgi:hypothetical protein